MARNGPLDRIGNDNCCQLTEGLQKSERMTHPSSLLITRSMYMSCFIRNNIHLIILQSCFQSRHFDRDRGSTFKMVKLIPAVVTAISLPFRIEKNENRRGMFDLFKGAFSSNFNDFFERAHVNVTSLVISTFGSCTTNATCDGQIGHIIDGRVDFSVFGSYINSNTPIERLYIGPFAGKLERMYQSLPYSSAYRSYSGVLNSANQASYQVHLAQAILLMSMYLLINVSCIRFNYKQYISTTRYFAWFLGKLNVFFRMPHRVITSTVFIINSLVVVIFFSCSFNAQMAIEHPAKYYESLKHLVQDHQAHGKDILMMSDSSIYRELARQDNSWSVLLKRARYLPIQASADIPLQVAEGSILISSENLIKYVRTCFCSNTRLEEKYSLLRESPPLTHESIFFVFSRTSSSILRSRISHLITFQLEGGMVHHDLLRLSKEYMAEIMSGDRLQIHRCEGRQQVLKWPLDAFTEISFSHCSSFFFTFTVLLLISSFIFVYEKMFYRSCSKFRSQ